MKTINLLAANNCLGSSLMGVVDFMQFSNSLWKVRHPNCDEVIFNYRLYAAEGETVTFSNGFTMPAQSLANYQQGDAVFLVSNFAHEEHSMARYVEACANFNEVLRLEHQACTPISTYCTGTFGLAQSGLLDEKASTTVWWMKNLFQTYFPKINLTLDELVVESDNLITGGATTSYFNVCMRLLEKLTDPIFANQMSKVLLLDKRRLSQQPFIDTSFIINKHDDLVERIQTWMVQHYNESHSLDEIAKSHNVSKRTLIRKFKASCGETPLNYLQKIRVERAKHYLESTDLPVERIVERVGYEDAASFRKLFVAQTQLTPKDYRKRFSYFADAS